MKINLNLECESTSSEVNTFDRCLKIELVGIDEDELISEILDNVNIEKLLMNIDTVTLKNELNRKISEE